MLRSRNRRLALYLLIGAGMYLALCFVMAKGYLSPIRRIPVAMPPLEERSANGTPVWTTPRFGSGKVLFVMSHGLGGARDTWSDLMLGLHERGYDCVAPAMPGQDAHPDPTIGFGAKEARTIAQTVEWARTQYGEPPKVVLVGLSMGGAAAWLASEIEPGVDGVVTEGAYARFDEAMNRFFDRRLPYGSVLFRPVVWFASSMSGTRAEEVVPLDSARKWRGRPSLVIQGSDDDLIQHSHAQRLAEASGGELWVVDKA
ncbi:MAG TPA: alpha/beta fold hydrolase, partial [Fimbriimonas sp.]